MRMFFDQNRYTIVRALLTADIAAHLFSEVRAMAKEGALTPDHRVPNTPACYGAPVMDRLLGDLCPVIADATGLDLYPTYSYFRLYKNGDILPRHTDREACEVSVSVNLGYDSDEPWPLWLEVGGNHVAVFLEPGDGVLYHGIELPHWRSAFNGRCAAQLFLHYVDKNGPYSHWRFDGRQELGTPSSSGRISG
jgi:hypothetical protein